MNLPEITIEELLESGVHFGHNVRRWNPKMEEYIFGVRNNIHIFDLRLTVPLINKALEKLHDVILKICSGPRITKILKYVILLKFENCQ